MDVTTEFNNESAPNALSLSLSLKLIGPSDII